MSENPEQRKRLEILGKRAFHVGVDGNYFSPVSIETIWKEVNK